MNLAGQPTGSLTSTAAPPLVLAPLAVLYKATGLEKWSSIAYDGRDKKGRYVKAVG